MDGQICHEGYTYGKFILYLYLCAAYADYNVNEEEIDLIKEKMLKFNLMNAAEFDKNWQKVLHDFKKHNDFESMQHIEECADELHINKAQREKIYNDLKDIIYADGKEEEDEKLNLFRFKKMLGLRVTD